MKARRLAPRPCVEELESRLVPSTTTSTNWSGYAVTAPAGSVTSVVGSWVVPTSSAKGTAYAAAWVGIDGYSSTSVEQIGTDSDVVNGTPTYYAWYEMYPSGSVNIAMTIKPGDTIKAQVSYASGIFTLQITDTPKNGGPVETFSINKSYSGAKRSSAEWIQEAPSSGQGVLPLADFGTINFSGAQATINGTTGTINNSAWSSADEEINMVTVRNVPKATTSGLTASGSAFSVTWDLAGGIGSGGGGGGGRRDTNQPAEQTALSAALTQALPQGTATQGTTLQQVVASPFAQGTQANIPASNAVLPTGASTTGTTSLSSLFGPARVSLYNTVAASNFTSSGGGDQNVGPSAPAADTPSDDPAPMEKLAPGAPPAVTPALQLSDACFLANGAALATPESVGGVSDEAEEQFTTVEGGVDAVFTLALGGLVAIAAETSSRRWSERNTRFLG